MLGWAVIFFVVAAMAAFLGFGGVATAFAGAAKITFFAALALLLLTLLFSFVPRARVASGARGAGLLAFGAVIGIGIYLWFANDMSAQGVGREIDRTASDIAEVTGDAADRTAQFVDNTVSEARNEAAGSIESEDNHQDESNP
jgi:uncharacterized membrane protein YtjA (UPF0391 family)